MCRVSQVKVFEEGPPVLGPQFLAEDWTELVDRLGL